MPDSRIAFYAKKQIRATVCGQDPRRAQKHLAR
jgi:hypothetical protein